MATYAVGDIQGCYDALQQLLDTLDFDNTRDHLWLTGDLVNRGPNSLEVLRFIKDLGDHAIIVLGNHDLHLLAVANGHLKYKKNETFHDVLNAPDRDELLDWLRHRPLAHHDGSLGYTLIHAGLPPQWDLNTTMSCAREVESELRGPHYRDYLESMYGNEPDCWSDSLSGQDRLRFITNCFTRLRFCDADGNLALEEKAAPGSQPAPFVPWFEVVDRASRNMRIIFGHWSTLGLHMGNGVVCLDTGCLWGNQLTAMRLDVGDVVGRDEKPDITSINCPELRKPGLD